MKKYFEENKDIQLIHITSCFEKIKSILIEGGLRLKYCEEEFCLPSRKISQRVHPMVCFMELNIHQLKVKKITYGKYGIAFTPEWIINNNIQPVMYMEKHSQVANALASLLVQRRRLLKGHPLRLPIMAIACFVKNTVGYNSHCDIEDFLFKEENEWRYVPTKKQIGGGFISESRKVFLNSKETKERYNRKLSAFPLKFDISKDIICIYCSTPEEAKSLGDQFTHLKDHIRVSSWELLDCRRKDKNG